MTQRESNNPASCQVTKFLQNTMLVYFVKDFYSPVYSGISDSESTVVPTTILL